MSLLGETMKIRREERGLAQGDLATQLHVTQQTVSRWERGLAIPRPGRVRALADALNVDHKHLLRVAGYLPPEQQSALKGPWHELYTHMAELTHAELMLLIDRAWEELRAREGLHPPGTR